jgi:hypothetical protein
MTLIMSILRSYQFRNLLTLIVENWSKFWSFMQIQQDNITSDKWSDQNNERFYHVKQTVENRRPSKMGDVATLLFVHFNFIIQFRNMFLFLKSIHIAYEVKCMLCLLSFIMLCFSFSFCFLKIYIIIQWYVRSVFWKKWRSVLFITWLCRSAVRN